jgi:hypothetical protein
MDRLEHALTDAGVPVVNLRRVFATTARHLFARGEYLYWRDDHHWNPRGIALAAREIARAWDELPRQRAPALAASAS